MKLKTRPPSFEMMVFQTGMNQAYELGEFLRTKYVLENQHIRDTFDHDQVQ